MNSLAVDFVLLAAAAALLLLYWTLSRAHFSSHFKQPNDIMVQVPLPHLDGSIKSLRQNNAIYGDIRCRHYMHQLPQIKGNAVNIEKSVWIIFVASADSLDIFDPLINQLLDQLIRKRPSNPCSQIHFIAYDRIGYGSSSTLHEITGHKLCISPPSFSPITAYDRAEELLSLLMNIAINDHSFNSQQDELILVGSMFGGLIAQSFLNVLATESHRMNVKLLLLDSPWIGIDSIIGRFDIRKLDCFKDYFLTIFGLQSSALGIPLPSMECLKTAHPGYESEVVRDTSVVRFYRNNGSQIMAQWCEMMGFWESVSSLGADMKEWAQQIETMREMHGINVRIYNLFSRNHENPRWPGFQRSISELVRNDILLVKLCLDLRISFI